MNATDTTDYQRKLRARRAERLALAAARSGAPRQLASAASSRSAERWTDESARADQERRSRLLRIVPGDD
jgi:hypothetical protein